jgi:hypothetical protein
MQWRKLKLKAKLKALHHISVSSAETKSAFNTGFDTVKLHRPTFMDVRFKAVAGGATGGAGRFFGTAPVEVPGSPGSAAAAAVSTSKNKSHTIRYHCVSSSCKLSRF